MSSTRQDTYQDGVVQGAQILNARIRQLVLMEVSLTPSLINQVAEGIYSEFGGEMLTATELCEIARVV